jgi:hypothetical protein
MWRLNGVHVDSRERRYDTEARRHFANLRRAMNLKLTVSKRPGDMPELPHILSAWADVKAVVILRDGRDCAVSRNPVSGDYMANARLWHTNALLLHKLHQDRRIFLVRYEDFVVNPDGHMRRIANWLDHEVVRSWEDVCTRYAAGDRLARTMGGARTINAESVGNWKKPEHRKRLAEVGSILVPQLVAWKYAEDDAWYREIVGTPD